MENLHLQQFDIHSTHVPVILRKLLSRFLSCLISRHTSADMCNSTVVLPPEFCLLSFKSILLCAVSYSCRFSIPLPIASTSCRHTGIVSRLCQHLNGLEMAMGIRQQERNLEGQTRPLYRGPWKQ